ncbi:hypothetical protein GJ744_001465 [Endocarpon pusillum]|uniref:Uncharacterized protein n=1 Tax=Endocarpon pusillum TaxID=364733 RepID=A0A8H7E8N5_9EURO|nr:hypothetical protein GJ744_001465 [Endocarpon pusillum]
MQLGGRCPVSCFNVGSTVKYKWSKKPQRQRLQDTCMLTCRDTILNWFCRPECAHLGTTSGTYFHWSGMHDLRSAQFAQFGTTSEWYA